MDFENGADATYLCNVGNERPEHKTFRELTDKDARIFLIYSMFNF